MRIAIDINHPADVHFFKNFIRLAKEKGNEILITASRKDVSLDLLDYYGLKYVNVGSYGGNIVNKLINAPIINLKTFKEVRKFQPEIFLGFASVRAAHVSFLLKNTKSYIFDDTEHASAKYLYLPFATYICTPNCFTQKNLKKQFRYNGYKELAYLHPNYFTPNTAILDKLELKKGDKYFIIRFVAWKAVHDIGHRGFSLTEKKELIEKLENYGRVFISSENPLPPDLESYKIPAHPAELHDVMAFSSMYIGEGATMASESALMGVPSIYVNPLSLGYISDEEKYGILFHLSDKNKAIEKAIDIAAGGQDRKFQQIRQIILKDKCDVTAWMLDTVLNGNLELKKGN